MNSQIGAVDTAELAKALFRRHEIDRIEMLRMSTAVEETGDKCGKIDRLYDPYRHEITEKQIEDEWDASPKMRAYWYQIASEAAALIGPMARPPTALPVRIKCAKCHGKGCYLGKETRTKDPNKIAMTRCLCGAEPQLISEAYELVEPDT